MIVIVLLFKAYLFLSIIYTIINLPQNAMYQWRHSKESIPRKIYGVFISFVLSMIFGGISLAQKIFRHVRTRVKTILAWYQVARTAKQLTKTLHDTLTDKEEKS